MMMIASSRWSGIRERAWRVARTRSTIATHADGAPASRAASAPGAPAASARTELEAHNLVLLTAPMMHARAHARRLTKLTGASAVIFIIVLMYDTAMMTREGASGVSAGARGARMGAFASIVACAACAAYARALDRRIGGKFSAIPLNRHGASASASASASATRAWNGSAWVEDARRGRPPSAEHWTGATPARAASDTSGGASGGRGSGDDVIAGVGSFGYGGYQDEVKLEDARARAERERVEQEKWARWEAEDEEREQRRAEKKAEKKAEKRAEKEKSRAKRWNKYDDAWVALEASSLSTAPLAYDDVPWPPKMNELLEREAGGADASDRDWKLAYHRCVKRWHPDKFTARFRARIDAGADAAKIAERVEAVAKALTIAYAQR